MSPVYILCKDNVFRDKEDVTIKNIRNYCQKVITYIIFYRYLCRRWATPQQI